MTATGSGVSISTLHCCAGPQDSPFEERHLAPTLAIVREGRFTYFGQYGRTLLQQGSILLGNSCAHYQCSHEDSSGDICTAFRFEIDDAGDATRAAGLDHRQGFSRSALPALEALLPAISAINRGDPAGAFGLLAAVAETLSGKTIEVASPTLREQRALRRVTDRIEVACAEELTLDDMARLAAMSRFHFLRCFKRIHGTTPYRYLLARRMSQAAGLLDQTDRSISDIAYDCGFGDLSTFNSRFKAVFGNSPARWRLRA